MKEQFFVGNPNLIILGENKNYSDAYHYKFRLKKSELQVYLALYFLRFGKSSKSLKINQISEYTGLKRTAIYEAIKTLQREGLIKIEGEMIYYLGIDDVEWNKDFIKISKSVIDKIIKSPSKLVVFLIISFFKNITIRDIARIGSLRIGNVIKAINELENEGLLIIRRVGKQNYYSIPMLEHKKEFSKQDQSQDKSIQSKINDNGQDGQCYQAKHEAKRIGDVLNDLGLIDRIDGQNGQSQNDKQNGQSRLSFPSLTASIVYDILKDYGEISQDKLLREVISIRLSHSERNDPERVNKTIKETEEALIFFKENGIIEIEKTATGYRIALIVAIGRQLLL